MQIRCDEKLCCAKELKLEKPGRESTRVWADPHASLLALPGLAYPILSPPGG